MLGGGAWLPSMACSLHLFSKFKWKKEVSSGIHWSQLCDLATQNPQCMEKGKVRSPWCHQQKPDLTPLPESGLELGQMLEVGTGIPWKPEVGQALSSAVLDPPVLGFLGSSYCGMLALSVLG